MAAGFLSAVLAVTGSTLWHGHPAAEGYLKGLVAALSLLNKLLLWKPILINLIFFFFFLLRLGNIPGFCGMSVMEIETTTTILYLTRKFEVQSYQV